MNRIVSATGGLVLCTAAWGCFFMLMGFAKLPNAPLVTGWKGRMIGLLAIMQIPLSWALGYSIVFAAILIGANPSGELIVIVANVGAVVTMHAAMYYFSSRWGRMDRNNDHATNEVSD